MDWLQTILLALVQGITEFLPVSSSAHLILPSQVFGWADQGLLFDVSVHIGTLLAVVLYFHKDLRQFLTGLNFQPDTQTYRLEMVALIVATLPAVVFGLLASDLIELHLRSGWVIAFTTVFFGILLWVADKAKSVKNQTLTIKEGAIVGFAQMLALIPGVSRSGVTITAARMLGHSPDTAARFSFLMSIPVIGGAMLLMLLKVDWQTVQFTNQLYVAIAVSAVFAYLTIHWFLQLLDRIGLMPFVIYRFILGAVLVWVLI